MDEVAKRIVARFGLRPHPEGGYFREVYRSTLSVRHTAVPGGEDGRRCGGTLIYYLLADRDFSAFHRVKWTDEIWHLYAGGPLELHTIDRQGVYASRLLTADLDRGEPAAVVPAGCWQAAHLPGGSGWAFGGCTVAPGFEFSDFEMPPAADLIAAHPEHASIVRALTRR